MAVTTKIDPSEGPSARKPDEDWVSISEEDVSQGYKTGHMRWVLGIGLILAVLAVFGIAVLS
jgi:hypothetical protein